MTQAAFSPDGRRLVTLASGREVRVWDLITGAELATLGTLKGWGGRIAWSPDGGRIAVGSGDGSINVFDAESGLELFALRGHTGYVASARRIAARPGGAHTFGCGTPRAGRRSTR